LNTGVVEGRRGSVGLLSRPAVGKDPNGNDSTGVVVDWYSCRGYGRGIGVGEGLRLGSRGWSELRTNDSHDLLGLRL